MSSARKNRKKALVIWILLLISDISVLAQLSAVSGCVIDVVSKEKIPGAIIAVVTKENGALVMGTVSDVDGKFLFIGLPPNEYVVKCLRVGYQTREVPLMVGEINHIYNLGKITLVKLQQPLDITPRANQPDKNVFDVVGNIPAAGGPLPDVMDRIPGVTVDREGRALLYGNNRVAVLVDGKYHALTDTGKHKGLYAILTSGIERIEIIHNPFPGRDNTGIAGIINIISKQRHKGVHGTASMAFGLGALTKRRADLPVSPGSYYLNPKFIPSLDLEYKIPKYRFFLQTELIQQKWTPDNEFIDLTTGDGTYSSQVPDNRIRTHTVVKSGVEWTPDMQNTFTLTGMFDFENHTDTAVVGFFDTQYQQMLRYWAWKEYEKIGLASALFNFTHKYGSAGHVLNLSLKYTNGWNSNRFRLYESSSIYTGSDTTHLVAHRHFTQFTAGYVRPMRKGHIEAGTKGQICRSPVTYSEGISTNSTIYPGMGNGTKWSEDVVSLYAKWVAETSRFGLDAGLQADYTNVSYSMSPDNIYYPVNDWYDYFAFFPDIRLLWKIGRHHRVSANYVRSINRPDELVLRIYPEYNNPALIKSGNPYLRPQYTQSYRVVYKYTWGNGWVEFSEYYKEVKSPFSRIFSLDGYRNSRYTIDRVFANTGKNTDMGIEGNIELKISRFWVVTGNLNWYYNRISTYDGTLYFPYIHSFAIMANNSNSWNTKIDNLFNIGSNSQLRLSSVYFSPRSIPQGQRHRLGGVSLEFKQLFNQKKLELTVMMSDIFNTMGVREELSSDSFHAMYENYYETQAITLEARYKF